MTIEGRSDAVSGRIRLGMVGGGQDKQALGGDIVALIEAKEAR